MTKSKLLKEYSQWTILALVGSALSLGSTVAFANTGLDAELLGCPSARLKDQKGSATGAAYNKKSINDAIQSAMAFAATAAQADAAQNSPPDRLKCLPGCEPLGEPVTLGCTKDAYLSEVTESGNSIERSVLACLLVNPSYTKAKCTEEIKQARKTANSSEDDTRDTQYAEFFAFYDLFLTCDIVQQCKAVSTGAQDTPNRTID